MCDLSCELALLDLPIQRASGSEPFGTMIKDEVLAEPADAVGEVRVKRALHAGCTLRTAFCVLAIELVGRGALPLARFVEIELVGLGEVDL